METVKALTLAIIVVVAAATVSYAQRVDERDQLRMAATYERGGDLRGAARIYQELLAGSPSNDAYFQGVVRTLSGLQQYDALLPLAETYASQKQSSDAGVLAGSLRARRGERDAAQQWWTRALDWSVDKEQTLVQISTEQRKSGLFDLALTSIRRARDLAGSAHEHPYSDELVSLLTLTSQYEEACNEIIDVFTTERDLYRAMRALTVVLASEGAIQYALAAVDRLSSTDEDHVRLQQWMYRQTKSWEKALATSEQLDRVTRSNGNEVLMFAEGARNDEQYEIALRAYDRVLAMSTDQRAKIAAAYGSVRTIEQQMRRSRELSVADAREIVRRYDDVIATYPQHPLCADALMHAARIEDGVLQQSDKARERLLRIQNQWRGTSTYAEAALLLATLYLAIGKDSEATEVLNTLIVAPVVVVGDRRDLARLQLADMKFWNNEIPDARRIYSELAEVPSSVAANDAIDRLLLLDLAQDDSASVVKFAQGEGLFARRQYHQAYATYMQISESARDLDLRDRASARAMESALAMRDDSLAVVPIRRVIERIPETIWGDRVLIRLAEIEERKGDVQAAITTLNSLLVAYPRSIFVPSARDRIRRLRGDL